MKISLNWLNEYVDLSGISPDEISHKLTMAGLEVEDFYSQQEKYKGFIVGLIKTKQKHPSADKLSLCTVFNGEKDLPIVCGAPNVAENQKVVFAQIGTIIPKGQFKIEKVKIRGIESYGMICSEAELELSDDHDGIMILPSNSEPGSAISEILKLNDVVFEIGITPNRPDALSHVGVARELATLYKLKLKIPAISITELAASVEQYASIEIRDTDNCKRYCGFVVRGVHVTDSPEWLKEKISKIGLRPINNIVDATNFVMYETGQPLHAFDLDLLSGQKIIVNSTSNETVFTTLDSKQRKLPVGTLMINDAEKPIAIAGIMGGANSEVKLTTKNVLIESAYFNSASIRRTSRALGLSTDASYRFERGIDPNNTLYAVKRAAQILVELDNAATVTKGYIDIYPKIISPMSLVLRFGSVERILGYQIEKNQIIEILESLGFTITEQNNSLVKVLVPTFRPDIEREIDIIEEVARIHGYDNIPTISKISVTLQKRIDESEFTDHVRNIANSLGFFEMINNPLVSKKLVSHFENPVRINNPQNVDMEYLRTSLLPSALSVTARNINFGERDLRLFEIGNVFRRNNSLEIKSFSDFTESMKIIFLLTGRASNKEWFANERNYDFFDLKGAIQCFLSRLSLDNSLNDLYNHEGNNLFEFLFTKSLVNKVLAEGGKVKKEILNEFGIVQDVYAIEFDLKALSVIKKNDYKYSEPSKFPKIFRDFAFFFDNEVTVQNVLEHIKSEKSKLLLNVRLFDLYEDDSQIKGKKSLAFSIEYGSNERTLTEAEVEIAFTDLINSIIKEFNATLRGM